MSLSLYVVFVVSCVELLTFKMIIFKLKSWHCRDARVIICTCLEDEKSENYAGARAKRQAKQNVNCPLPSFSLSRILEHNSPGNAHGLDKREGWVLLRAKAKAGRSLPSPTLRGRERP